MGTLQLFSPKNVSVSSENWVTPVEEVETRWVGSYAVLSPESENFDELGNNPAFNFWNEPGEDIYDD
jgi:hypothetical protein